MFQRFYELFNALNKEALEKVDQDVTLIEDAQRELLDAWTDYMMSRTDAPTAEEFSLYHDCLSIVEQF